jgi:hypothetical protein
MPAFPPTPTVPPAPASGPTLQGGATLFADSFDSDASLANWQIADVGEVYPGEESVWRTENGTLLQDRTAYARNPDFRDTMVLTGDAEWKDYTISAKAYNAANAVLGLVARQQDSSFYRFRWFAAETDGDTKMVLEKVVDGQITALASAPAPGHDYRRWYTISLTVSGSTITASIDGAPVLQATDSTLTSGRAGVTTIAFGAVNFDDVSVTAP